MKKISNKKIYFEYYHYNNHERLEGFLFLGSNISLFNTISNFYENFSPPKLLTIFITKKYRNGKLVDRKNSIIKTFQDYYHRQIIEIYYIDDFLWKCTLIGHEMDIIKRSDYIDQKLYAFDPVSNNEYDVGISTDFFKKIKK